jgi:hypothetical protein
MTYISIGNACNVKVQIDRVQKGPTHFFDWLMTSFETVLQVLRTTNIADAITEQTLTIKPIPNRTEVTMTAFDSCVSIHDIPQTYTPIHVQTFIEVYRRRHTRLLELIRSDEPLFFIRHSVVSNAAAKRFVAAIKNINPNCRFALIIVGGEATPFKNHVARIQLTERAPLPTDIGWHTPHFAWGELWSLCDTIKGLL